MKKTLSIALLALSCLAAVPASQAHTLQQVNAIETEYARINGGAVISDSALEYYLDRSDAGWSMGQISDDMAQNTGAWHPRTGWVSDEVVCSSIDNRYNECQIPFRGDAMITTQVSSSPCIEGRSWGQKPGVVWVSNGCRARFGVTMTSNAPPVSSPPVYNPPAHVPPVTRRAFVTCQSYRGAFRRCATGFRGRVVLNRRLRNSSSCIAGRTWGQREGSVWVSRNCRAEFASVGRPGPRDDDRWTRDDNYSVTCASTGGGRTLCTWDDRYGTPRMVEQMSQSACIEGRDWGYDRQGQLWVTSGCRARFGFR